MGSHIWEGTGMWCPDYNKRVLCKEMGLHPAGHGGLWVVLSPGSDAFDGFYETHFACREETGNGTTEGRGLTKGLPLPWAASQAGNLSSQV